MGKRDLQFLEEQEGAGERGDGGEAGDDRLPEGRGAIVLGLGHGRLKLFAGLVVERGNGFCERWGGELERGAGGAAGFGCKGNGFRRGGKADGAG